METTQQHRRLRKDLELRPRRPSFPFTCRDLPARQSPWPDPASWPSGGCVTRWLAPPALLAPPGCLLSWSTGQHRSANKRLIVSKGKRGSSCGPTPCPILDERAQHAFPDGPQPLLSLSSWSRRCGALHAVAQTRHEAVFSDRRAE